MKKIISAFLLIMLANIITLQAYCDEDQDFIEHFSQCRTYIDNGDAKIIIIHGFANRDCHYEEFTYNKAVKCAFTLSQLIKVSEEMRNLDYKRISGIQSLPFLQNSEVEICKSRIMYGSLKNNE